MLWLQDNTYWLGLMTHLQADTVPMKSIECLRDLKLMNEAVTIDDIYDAYSQVGNLPHQKAQPSSVSAI